MSSTNKTLTIELSQYVGTDKPTFLTDYNGDMLKIDNAIAADRDSIATAQSKADGADAKADTNATAIATLDGQVNNESNGLAKRVTDVEGDVNTIESLIGNGTPTTTDKTIIGAINELDADVNTVESTVEAMQAHTFGTAVDLTPYNTVGSEYTTLSDGYVNIESAGSGTGNYAMAVVNGVPMIKAIGNGTAKGTNGIFVRKGMTVYVFSSDSGYVANFYPLT